MQVRSRSLTQLDALGTSMLDEGEHQLGSGSSQQQDSPRHQQPPHHHSQTFGETNPRFLVPGSVSADGTRPNRTRHKLSRSQVRKMFFYAYLRVKYI